MAATDSPKCLKVLMEEFVNAVYVRGTPGKYRYTGPVVNALHILEDHLGLCFRFFRTKQQTYGARLPNGSWTGVMGQLHQQKVDFAGTLFTVSMDRYGIVDFSEHIYLDEISAAYVRPGVVPNMAGFVQPYTFLVWLLMLVASFLVLGTITVQLNFLQRSKDVAVLDADGLKRTSGKAKMIGPAVASWQTGSWLEALQRSGLWTWSALLAQSVPWEPSGGVTRGMAGLWLLAAFTLGSVYRSNLKAMLIITKVTLPFDTLGELADSGISAGIIKGSTIHHQIMDASNSSNLGRLKKNLRLYYVDKASLAIRDLYLGKMAAVSFSQGLLSTMHTDFSKTGECRIYRISRGFLGPTILSIAFPKGSPLKAKFDPVIFSLRESGIMNKLFMDILFNATECAKPVTSSMASSNQRPLEMMDFFGVFSLYVIGLLVAAAVFFVEMFRGANGR